MNPRWIALAAIAVQAQLVWTVSGAALVPLAALGISTAAVFATRPPAIARSHAWLVAIGLAALLLAKHLLAPPMIALFADDRFEPWSLPLAEYLLLLQALSLWRRSAQPLSLWTPALALGVLVCVFRQRYVLGEERSLLAWAIVSVGLVALQLAATAPAERQRAPFRWQRRQFHGGVLLAAGACAWFAAPAWRNLLLEMEDLRPALTANAAARTLGTQRYVESGTLDAIAKSQLREPRQLALSVYALRPPGYLRGRVFDTYARSHWVVGGLRRRRNYGLPVTGDAVPLKSIPASVPPPTNWQQTFALSPRASDSEPLVAMTVENEPGRGDLCFLPLGTRFVQGSGSRLGLGDHDVVLTGLVTRETYSALCAPKALAPPPDDAQLQWLLLPPLGLAPEVGELSRRVCQGQSTSRAKIDAVVKHFRQRYRYDIDTPAVPQGHEPLSHFLLEGEAGHCEYFASGAIALLRYAGVPCRYATGYVVVEFNDNAECWIARNSNAHAWAEAYDREEQRWVIVEATPGVNVPTELDATTIESVAHAAVGQAQVDADTQGDFWLTPRQWFVQAIKHAPAALLAVVALGAAVYWLRSRRGIPLRRNARQYRTLWRELAQADRRVRRRGFTRAPHETLHRFADRLSDAACNDEELSACAAWYVRYAQRRYACLEGKLPQRSA